MRFLIKNTDGYKVKQYEGILGRYNLTERKDVKVVFTYNHPEGKRDIVETEDLSFIEVDNLNWLMELEKELDKELIIGEETILNETGNKVKVPSIEIYDGYRE